MNEGQAVVLWGRHLEDELAYIEVVVTYVLTHGPIDAPTAWVRGRLAPVRTFATREALDAFVSAAWFPEHVFYLRQVPGLRFDTGHGSVTVTDVWGETDYRTLRNKAAKQSLRVNSPLLHVAARVDELRVPRGDQLEPVIVVSLIGLQETEPLLPRARLQAWSSCTGWPSDGPRCEWISEPNDISRSGATAVVKAFREVNDPDAIQAGLSLMDDARRCAAQNAGVDVTGGIAELERYANAGP